MSTGGSAVTAYKLTRSAAGQPSVVVWKDARDRTAAGYAAVSAALRAGTQYSFAVQAYNAAGGGATGVVTFALPVRVLYAYSAANQTILKVPTETGAATVAATGIVPNSLTTDAQGNLYASVGATRSIVKIPADGSARTTYASGFTNPGAIAMDRKGNLFVNDAGKIVAIGPNAGSSYTVLTLPAGSDGLSISRSGLVYATWHDDTTEHLITVAPGTTKAVDRVIGDPFNVVLSISGDDQGNLYLYHHSTGGSGYTYYTRVAANATTETDVYSRQYAYFAGSVGSNNRFYLLQTATWCVGPDFSCVPNRSVPDLLAVSPTASRAVIAPVSGLTLPSEGADVRADADGNVFVLTRGSSAKILKIGATGGAARVLATGAFTLSALSN